MAWAMRRISSGGGDRLREIRLRALADSPTAFASTYDAKAAFEPTQEVQPLPSDPCREELRMRRSLTRRHGDEHEISPTVNEAGIPHLVEKPA